MRRLLAASVLALIALSCSDGNVLTRGEVIEKDFDDPDTGSELYCSAYRSNGVCLLWLSRDTYDGPHWKLRVVGVDDEGKERREWHEVTETLYELAEVGLTVDFPGDRVVPR